MQILSPLEGEAQLPISLVCNVHCDFLPKSTVQKGGKLSNFVVEIPSKHYLKPGEQDKYQQ